MSLEISHLKADGSNDCLQIAISKSPCKNEIQRAIWQTAVCSQPSAPNLIWGSNFSLCRFAVFTGLILIRPLEQGDFLRRRFWVQAAGTGPAPSLTGVIQASRDV